jgi:hypothetical protein
MNSFNGGYDQMKNSGMDSFSNIDIAKFIKDKTVDENNYFLLLSVYFYLKHNNYHQTAEILFNETNLGKIFQFPQDIGEPNNEMEKLKKKFINYFYYNTFFRQCDTSDFLSDFWNQFWEIFVNKIKQSSNNVSEMDLFLKNSTQSKLTCKLFLFKKM